MDIFLNLILLGLIVGFISSLFGVGGGIVIVPALFFLFPHLPAQTVIGSSLLFITVGSLINLRNFWRSGMRPNHKLLRPVLITAVIGVIGGGWFANHLDKSTIQLIFATIISIAAVRILIQALSKHSPHQKELEVAHLFRGSLVGLLGGSVSGLTGLGGGVVMVPLLISWYKIPLRKVSLYSNCIMPITAGIGTLIFLSMPRPTIDHPTLNIFQVGQLNLGISLTIVMGCLISSPWGVHTSQKIPRILLQYLFSILLIAIAIKIFWSNFNSLNV